MPALPTQAPCFGFDTSILLWALWLATLAILGLALFWAVRRKHTLAMALQAALQDAADSNTRNRAIQAASPDAIITIDASDAIISFNPAAERIFGCAATEVIGQPMADRLVPSELREQHRQSLVHCASTPGAPNLRRETMGQHADGTQFPIELGIVRVSPSHGQPAGDADYFIATVRDITAAKQDQAEKIDLSVQYGNLARDLASRKAALERAQARELEIGSHIQQAMLVASPTQSTAGLWVASFNQASKGIDGDFFDVLRVGKNAIDLIAGDVMGKGVPAALMGAATKLQFNRSIAELLLEGNGNGTLPQPKDIVARVNQAIGPNLHALDSFVTLVYIRIDLEKNTICWVGCGHEEPLLLRTNGSTRILPNQHPPVGVLLDESFEQSECSFEQTDSLFMASDGASDALLRNGQRVGRDELGASICRHMQTHQTPSMALHSLRREVLTTSVDLTDDLTLVMVNRYCTQRNVVRLDLPIALESLGKVRGMVRERAAHAGFDAQCSNMLEVAAVEVVSNVIRHAQGLLVGAPMEVFGEITADELLLQFRYIGDCYLPPQDVPLMNFATLGAANLENLPEGGFGLGIIHQVVDVVKYQHEDGVNAVELRVRR